MIDFSLGVLGTTVSSDKVSTDGHEPSNLISTDLRLKRTGFMTEHFIKPPVNITFIFPCHISIHQVTAYPSIGQQQSLQFEIFAAAKPISKAMREGKKLDKVLNNPSSVRSETPPFFYNLAKMSVSNSAQMCFYNPNSNANVQHQSSNIPLPASFENKAVLRHSKKELLTACSHLCVRITQTRSGSTACLSNIAIWGVPSHSLSNVIRAQIQNKYNSIFSSSTKCGASASGNNGQTSDVKQLKSNPHSVDAQATNSQELDIPEDFVDPITCEVMAVPMLLPSGKNVDMGTLDRFFKSEASFGRKPRDPFTGVEFTDSCRPLPNGALKIRIDHYLLKHSQDAAVASVARTVGTAKSYTKKATGGKSCVSVSSLAPPAHKPRVGEDQPVMEMKRKSYVSSATPPSVIPKKKAKTECLPFPKGDHHTEHVSTSSNERSRKVFVSSPSSDLLESHESRLKDSLDSALQAMLGQISSSPSSSRTNSDMDAESNSCSLCQKPVTSSCVAYGTPCSHIVCRNCLTQALSKTIKCPSCGNTYLKADVIRVHNASTV
ncbi:RING finger protein 37 [Aplysia californica]|uniref:RING finger protein 37 n=1 Tax=Aplysia californica TaxID=6500 RepID=A0ABM1A0W3_APLCA|nr:RING finger protein 37 [Aplysia californica]XP_012938555.1 RING finger protein 37 [Aplysia californica]